MKGSMMAAISTGSAFAITLNGADENHFRILLAMAPSGSEIDKAGLPSERHVGRGFSQFPAVAAD